MENIDLIKNAMKYINNLGSNATNLDEVAKNAGFSTDYFNRIFRNHTGFNVMEYVKFRKLNRAARMLRTSPEREILSIALDSGYESHEGFSREFKEQYEKTPSEYRENMKGKPLVWADNELNATAVAENLVKAVKLDASLAKKAKNDMEFKKFAAALANL